MDAEELRSKRGSFKDPLFETKEILVRRKGILVLGIGNLLLKDEGVGVHAVQKLQEMDLPDHVEVVDGGTAGLDLLEWIDGRDKVVVIDAVKSGGIPGTIYRFSGENIKEVSKPWLSLHDIDITDLLKLIDMLGVKKPEVIVIGIEAKDIESVDLELSKEIEAQIPKVIEQVMKEISL
jgi:hydrogenase maturation protease